MPPELACISVSLSVPYTMDENLLFREDSGITFLQVNLISISNQDPSYNHKDNCYEDPDCKNYYFI